MACCTVHGGTGKPTFTPVHVQAANPLHLTLNMFKLHTLYINTRDLQSWQSGPKLWHFISSFLQVRLPQTDALERFNLVTIQLKVCCCPSKLFQGTDRLPRLV